jgi:hypothetical protein
MPFSTPQTRRRSARLVILAAVLAAPLAMGCAGPAQPSVAVGPAPVAMCASAPVVPPASGPALAPVTSSAAPLPADPPPADPPSRVVDERGCVRNVVGHAAGVALQKLGGELEAALGQRPTLTDFTQADCVRIEADHDLDGDGVPDSDVSLCLPVGNHVWFHYLYFSNKGCPKFAGQFRAADLRPLAPSRARAAIKDLESIGVNGCAGGDFMWERWSWTGAEYTVVDSATCHLCPWPGMVKTGPGVNQHPYCKKEIARRRINP